MPQLIKQKFLRSLKIYLTKLIMISFVIFYATMNAAANENLEELANQPNATKKFYWPQNHFDWYYSNIDQPEWLDNEKSLQLFTNAEKAWQACGLQINFKGIIYSSIKQKDGLNILGWRALPPSFRGLTLRQTKNDTFEIIESDVMINPLNQDIKNSPRLLQKVVTHEFGHALGLVHSDGCEDVMSSANECGAKIKNPPPIEVTEKDIAQCKLRYSNN